MCSLVLEIIEHFQNVAWIISVLKISWFKN